MSLERVKHLDLYTLFGVDRNADEKSIKRSYRKLSRSCHPDKHPDKDTVELFHQLSDAIEVLTVKEYKKDYDKIWEAKQLKKEKDEKLDKDRKKFKEKLEQKEALHDDKELDEEDRRQQVIYKLREEGRQLLEQDQEDVLRKFESLFISKTKEDPILKIKWSKEKRTSYTEENIRSIFNKYGNIANVVVKKCSGLVEFETLAAAKIALNIETGFAENPLTIKPLFKDTESKHIFTKYPCMKSETSLNDSIKEMEEFVFAKLLQI